MPNKKSSPQASSARAPKTKKHGKRRTKSKPAGPSDPSKQRLNKVLAAAGLGSRREVEELIIQGRVEIDREIVTDLSRKVDPRQATIKVDSVVLKQQRLVYHALNKPTGVLSTNRDPDGRIRVIDLVPGKERVFSVGRLDRSSEGLILLTNDGELAQRLAHPKFAVQKAYFVVVSGVMEQEELNKLRKGVHLAEGFARIDGATIRRQRKGCTELEIVLSEGKNREIRRILARAGHKVVVLRRIAIGPLRLGQLPVGASRQLNPTEVKALYAATQKPVAKKPSTKPPGKTAATGSDSAPVPATAMEDDDDEFEMDMDDEFPILGEELSDDDFVGHFSSNTAGSVLSYDDEESTPAKPKTPAKKRGSTRGSTRGGKTSTSSKSAASSSSRNVKHSSKSRPAKQRSEGERGSSKPAGKKSIKHRSSKGGPKASRGSAKKSGKPSASSGSRKPTRSPRGKGSKGR